MIGQKVPEFRVPAVINNNVAYFDSHAMNGRWWALCFLPHPDLIDLIRDILTASRTPALAVNGLSVLLVEPRDGFRTAARASAAMSGQVATLTDPLGRLHRRFGLDSRRKESRKCRTFLVDPGSSIRFQLVHDFDAAGLRALIEVFMATQSQHLEELV